MDEKLLALAALCRAILQHCRNEWTLAYTKELLNMLGRNPSREKLAAQIGYVLDNMATWRGELAKSSKVLMRAMKDHFED